jgi:hypothetical protein
MKKADKIIFVILILIEVASYFFYKPESMEMFFLVWAFLFLVLLVYRWNGYGFNLFGIGMSDTDRYQNLAMSEINAEPRRNKIVVRKTWLFDLLTTLGFVVNLVASILSY